MKLRLSWILVVLFIGFNKFIPKNKLVRVIVNLKHHSSYVKL